MKKIDDCIFILEKMGLPGTQQNERSALTLLALLDLKKNTPWSKSKKRPIRIHDILTFIREHYGKSYAENTRETIRRQTIHQFEQAGIVIRNPDDYKRATNSPKTVYAISDDDLKVIQKHGTGGWNAALREFIKKKGRLGCSQCYASFKTHIIPLVKKIHSSTHHKGKLPRTLPEAVIISRRLSSLKDRLARAIQLEEYEEAAGLRDKIRDLERKKRK